MPESRADGPSDARQSRANREKSDRGERIGPETGPPIFVGRAIGFIIAIVLAIVLVQQWGRPEAGTAIPYSTFREQVESGNVESVTISGQRVQGSFRQAIETSGEPADEIMGFVTHLPAFGNESLLSDLEAQGVELTVEPETETSWLTLLYIFSPLLILFVLGFLVMRQMRGQSQGVFSMGRNRARFHDQGSQKARFDDVAGAANAKKDLQEVVQYLEDPSRVQKLGGTMPKGALLVGPPGTGKTLLARAVAGEAGVPFFSITGSDFMEMFVGIGASRVRDLFEQAKKQAPSIIFVDELDSIGRRRGAGLGAGHDEREQTLNQLLNELDGFEPNTGVIVLAATNRPDVLDPALLRPGRFDRQIPVDLPTQSDRVDLFRIHSRKKPLEDDVDLEAVARAMPGASGADIANLMNEAALVSARRRKTTIGRDEIDAARDKVLLGARRENLTLTSEECRLLAYHEAGHAVVAVMLPHADPLHRVTIVPRNRALGMTEQLPETEQYTFRREYLLDRLAVMMAGRAAEDKFLNTRTSGAEQDLRQATFLARKMIVNWGMGRKLTRMAWGTERDEVFLGQEVGHQRPYSEATARDIDEETGELLDEAYRRAEEALERSREGVDKLAEALFEREELPRADVLDLLGVDAKPVVTAPWDG